MEGAQVGELVVLIFCICLYAAYLLWYFLLKGCTFSWGRKRGVVLWAVTRQNRALWTEAMMAESKEAIVAVQTLRNSVTGVAILAASNAALASALLQIITDPTKIDQVSNFSSKDPISGDAPLLSPEVKLAIALGALFLSLLSFSQSVRLSIHLGFMVRVVPQNNSKSLRKQSIKIAQRSALYLAIGLRFMFAFMPLIMWLLGPLALLIATVILVVALFFLDYIPTDDDEEDSPNEHGKGGGVKQVSSTESLQQPAATASGGRADGLPVTGAVTEGARNQHDEQTLLAVSI